jgi:prolyl-tRNA synthetase
MIDGKLQPDPESKLTEPYIIRPTSETIIGEAMSRWVQSYRDLPLKLNQWVNVMRWEMRPRMFLRTSEFNWQEGHNVFATHEEANADARKMHKMYAEYMANVLAIPVIMGEKTVEERIKTSRTLLTMCLELKLDLILMQERTEVVILQNCYCIES